KSAASASDAFVKEQPCSITASKTIPTELRTALPLSGDPQRSSTRVLCSPRFLGALLHRRFFARRAFAGGLTRLFLTTSLNAFSQRIHQVHDIRRTSRNLFLGRRQPCLLGADQLDHRVLVAILELLRLELTRHAVNDFFRESYHLVRELQLRDLIE